MGMIGVRISRSFLEYGLGRFSSCPYSAKMAIQGGTYAQEHNNEAQASWESTSHLE